MNQSARLLVIPTAVFAVLYLILTYAGVDMAVARWLYNLEGGHWALRDAPILNAGFHTIGKQLSTGLWLIACGLLANDYRRFGRSADPRPTRLALWQTVLGIAVATLVVSTAKSLTHMDCPWDLVDFGGSKHYVHLLARDRLNTWPGKCFPAGQASAGYAWVTLYFSALLWRRPQLRYAGLLIGLVFGATLGIAQQLRGAHFVSHDLTTLWISWIVAAVIYHALSGSRTARLVPYPRKELTSA